MSQLSLDLSQTIAYTGKIISNVLLELQVSLKSITINKCYILLIGL